MDILKTAQELKPFDDDGIRKLIIGMANILENITQALDIANIEPPPEQEKATKENTDAKPD